jgi:hypothetical protein
VKATIGIYMLVDYSVAKKCQQVTYGLASPLVEGTLFNSHPIPKGYAIVLVDRVKPGHRRSKLEYPRENDE